MDHFKRAFALELLADHRGNGGLAALLERWVLPGEDSGAYGLRLAIRNGYINFYVKGQSVGELRFVRKSPRLRLHSKYRSLIGRGSPAPNEVGQRYEVIDADALSSAGPDLIDSWIRTAETYAGDEKRFVDDLVAVTPGTIDLEMGLPADADAVGKNRIAPRMDMVVAQGGGIAFWEAKCAVNSELRARADYKELPDGRYGAGPHVLWQLCRYQAWVGRPTRFAQVREAYIESTRLLLKLAELSGKHGPAIEAWRELNAAGEKAEVVLPPGIVVAGYCPSRADNLLRPESCGFAAAIKSFSAHSERLLRHGATVVTVNAKPSGSVLPKLQPGSIGVQQGVVKA